MILSYSPLGQFVELGVAQPLAERSDALVVLRSDRRTVIAFRAFTHRAELKDPERLPAVSEARTAVEDRTRALTLDEERQETEDGGQEHQPQDGNENVKEALEPPVGPGSPVIGLQI
jgi:hypothetical protein